MKNIIGMIGGVSWESTVTYYRLMNEAVRNKRGGLNSARILINSMNYDEIVNLERQNKWDDVANILILAAQSLEKAGASFVILACNTLHKVAPQIEQSISIPFIHIADSVGEALQENNFKTAGLIGTQFTMEEGFYANRLTEKFNIKVIIPAQDDRQLLDKIVYDELCVGKVLDESRIRMVKIIHQLASNGAQAVILGCTEFNLIVKASELSIPAFDTTELHTAKAVSLTM